MNFLFIFITACTLILLWHCFCKWFFATNLSLSESFISIQLGLLNQISGIILKPIPAALTGLAVPVAMFSVPPTILAWLICFVLDDFIGYWIHRMAHRTGWGWVDHIAHHSAPEFNFATALRLGVLGPLTPAVLAPVPLVLLGFPLSMVISAHLANAVYQLFVHTEKVRLLPRPIEFVFNTPQHHRLHHARNVCYLDCNYGGVFILWDRLFGTFRAATEPALYGTADGFNAQNALRIAVEPAAKLLGGLLSSRGSLRTVLSLLFGSPRDWWPAQLRPEPSILAGDEATGHPAVTSITPTGKA